MGGQRSQVGGEEAWRRNRRGGNGSGEPGGHARDGERGMKREGAGSDRLAPREGFFPGGAELVGSARAWGRWPPPTMSVAHSWCRKAGPGRRQKCTCSSSA